MTAKLAGLLGYSIAMCTLWWPVGFVVVKGSLKLRYRWWAFLLGYVAVVVVNMAALASVGFFLGSDPTDQPGEGQESSNWFTLCRDLGIPLTISVVMALFMAPYLRQKTPGPAESR
jgi:hypothetical protein